MNSKLSVVIRFSSLGDIVLTSAFVKKLSEQTTGDPDHGILYVTLDSWSDFVVEYFPCSHLKCYNFSKPRNLWTWLKEGARLAEYLEKNKLGLSELKIFDLHNVGKSKAFLAGFRLKEWKSRFFARSNRSHWTESWDLKKARKILSSPKFRWRRFLTLYFKLPDNLLKSWPVFARHQRLLDVSSTQQCATPQLNILSASLKDPRNFRLTLVVDAQNWKKRWPTEYWTQLLQKLARHTRKRVDIKVVAAKADCLRIPELDWGHHRIRDLQGQTDLSQLPLIAESSDLVVCGNSAWLHIAESVGTPVLTLSGPIVEEFGFHPWRKESINLEEQMWCRPCSLHGKGLCYNWNQLNCMKSFPADRVYSIISQQISQHGAKL